jgi:hypothetical protein
MRATLDTIDDGDAVEIIVAASLEVAYYSVSRPTVVHWWRPACR